MAGARCESVKDVAKALGYALRTRVHRHQTGQWL